VIYQIFQALSYISLPISLIVMFLGLITGTIFGALPGLTTTMAIALFIPFTYGWPPNTAFLFLLGLYCGGVFGGSISAILLSTPGTPASCITVLDGFPLSKQGKAVDALRTAILSSAIGGLISAFLLILIAPQLARAGLTFGAHEYFALGFLGLSVIISVSSDSLAKGLSMGLIGLLFSTIGMDRLVGYQRFTFGFFELFEGLPFIPVMIGLFAISEILLTLESFDDAPVIISSIKIFSTKWKQFKDLKKTILKSGIIGSMVGILPGAGGAIASLLAYNEAKRSSNNPDKFGKGAFEGVAASEAANNAVTGGALIPLLTLGIPGDSVTALLLGAFLLHGYQVGPLLLKESPALFYTIGLGLIYINLIMIFVGFVASKYMAKVLEIPKYTLYPVIFILAIIGTFAINTSFFEIAIMLIAGGFGYLLKKAHFPIMPMILGIILGPMIEINFRRALLSGLPSLFFTRPISLILIVLGFLSITMAIRSSWRLKKSEK